MDQPANRTRWLFALLSMGLMVVPFLAVDIPPAVILAHFS